MRRVGTVAALVACILHALVLPVLASTMKANQRLSSELAQAMSVICHSGETGTDGSDAAPGAVNSSNPSSGQNAPAKGDGDCPICKGLAAFQFALLVLAVLGLIESSVTEVYASPEADPLAGQILASPRNRGPPLPA